MPKGADAFQSLVSHWPAWRPEVIFDVGANVGQTVARLRPWFPTSRIYSFEPFSGAFSLLQKNVASDPNVTPVKVALGSHAASLSVALNPASDQNSLVSVLSAEAPKREVETIDVTTATAFAASRGIKRIGLLKIDVEGYELEVIEGTRALFREGAIDFVVSEAGLIPENPRFTPLARLQEVLGGHGFVLIAICEQHGVRFSQSAEFCNALFAHERFLRS